ncbi:hypothetical protein KQ940_15475 [Marinobacterium sp. D7]|uniref:hypothetical protein n=1 Tax=Marinobacterium ramblicola TaxID=2849041 RepID=UPI001C2D8BCD|nr:hypothetical protein [Marinobacterium ramblicola]MBV1789454.1 hypothetical protein [Marinobacterium ramblicola]
MLSTEFLLTSLIVVLIPGTGVLYTLSTGLFLGFRASLFAAIGCIVLAFLPLFVPTGTATPMTHMLVLGLVFMVMTLLGFLLYGGLANGFRRYVLGSPRVAKYMQCTFAVTFAALGAKLALAER